MAGQEASWRAQDDLVGKTLGGCVITDLIGQGGMARVYRAHQTHLDRDVAIKVLPPYYASDQNFVRRFEQEARSLARLSHPNILVIHDAGDEQGLLYIIMEYIAGGTLRDYMTQSMSLREVTRIMREVASALAYAHERGIIHRDVKPVNVLMDTSKRAVLSDFGIAKVMATSAVMTRSGAGVGTPEYMSPEQCRGGQVDARADIYALGVMLYELLTGHTPFEADNYTALAHSHIYELPPPPSKYNPRISPAVQAVTMKALEKDPADRFQQAMDMAITLEQAAAAQAPLPPAAAPERRLSAGPEAQERGPQTGAQGVTCPRCQNVNHAHQRFCSTCGLPLGQSRAPQASAHMVAVTHDVPAGFVLCPSCQTPNDGLNRFCTRCGSNMLRGVSGRKCQKCGMQNSAGARFCTTCGAGLG
ncbi:MAG TPA: serine/threonine-protein kinase [Ktedonobacterales bacterium]|nr:serine/threonine-protein kinase [Ktedonobacterales bacterium]